MKQPNPSAPTLAVVGAGRAGTALAVAATTAGHRVVAVHSRTPESARRLAARVGAEVAGSAVAAVRAADVTFLTVPDAAVTRVAATVAATGMGLGGRGVVHCSGAQPAAAIGALRHSAAAIGNVHPLQALADADSAPALRGAFFAIEADERLRPVLERLVLDIGGIPFAAPTGDRALYHAAAVLAGNAPLALLSRASGLLEAAGVDPAVAHAALATLLEGAARNARRLGAGAALTGPVVRDDAATVARHLHALRHDGATQRLYHRLAVETLRAAGSTGREHVAELLGGPRGGRTPEPRRRGATPAIPALARVGA